MDANAIRTRAHRIRRLAHHVRWRADRVRTHVNWKVNRRTSNEWEPLEGGTPNVEASRFEPEGAEGTERILRRPLATDY